MFACAILAASGALGNFSHPLPLMEIMFIRDLAPTPSSAIDARNTSICDVFNPLSVPNLHEGMVGPARRARGDTRKK